MRVLLISANTVTTPYPVYPLGLDYVADALAAEYRVRVVDMNGLGEEGALTEAIGEFSPHVIGLSLRNVDDADGTSRNSFMAQYRGIVRVVRQCSRAPLVLGGSGFTIFPGEIMDALGADYGIVGEGERLPLLLEALKRGEDPSPIPGVVTPSGRKKIPAPFDRAFSLGYIPHASRVGYYLRNGGMLNLQSKRGCPYRCIYCTYPRIEGRRLRLTRPEDVAQNALRLQNAGARYFFITDSVFNSHYSHSLEVARAFMEAGVSIPWGAFFAPANPPEGYFETMAEAGLSHVEFGTESLSGRMLKTYGKPFETAHVLRAHRAAVEAGLYVAHYFLLGGPGEDRTTLEETLTHTAALDRCVLFFFALCASTLIPGFMRWHWRRAR